MLRVLHLLFNVSPKRYRELKRFAEAWQISIAKPTKATGTSWIEHKINAMNIALENGFSWTMMKLRAFRNKSLNEPTSKLSHYKRVILTCRPKPLMHMFIPFEYIFFLQLNCAEVWYFQLALEQTSAYRWELVVA